MKKTKTKKIKNPLLKFRYSRGLGDAIASILHSRFLGWLTHLITGRHEPCQTCSMRADALNVLFPIPFWRLFFKNAVELTDTLAKDLEDNGFVTQKTKDNKGVSASMSSSEEHKTSEVPVEKDRNDMNNYKLVSKTKEITGDFLIEINVYKYN